jgi:hypothetical protein
MSKTASAVLGEIQAIDSLVEDFPISLLSLLNQDNKYDSVIAFVLDVLDALGYDYRVLITIIIGKIFKVKLPNPYALPDAMAGMDNVECEWLQELEDVVKVSIVEILTALLSCNIDCEIPNWYMDSLETGYCNGMYNISKIASGSCGNLRVPVSVIDIVGKLNICPASTIGFNYYDMGNDVKYRVLDANGNILRDINGKVVLVDNYSQAWKLAEKDETRIEVVQPWTANNVYKTNDLDAFLWFVINRGINEPQKEKNKMVWDSRMQLKRKLAKSQKDGPNSDKKPSVSRNTEDEWDYWLKSKSTKHGTLYASGATYERYTLAYDEETQKEIRTDSKIFETGYDNSQELYPIMQLGVDSAYTEDTVLTVAISAQRYFKGVKKGSISPAASFFENMVVFNHSIYKFNYDYVKNIKIFNYRTILIQLITYILSGKFISDMQNSGLVNASFTMEKINRKIVDIVNNMIVADDVEVNDCFFDFSNDELDEMLRQSELNRYGARMAGSDGSTAYQYDNKDILKLINNVNAQATPNGTITAITKTINEVYATTTGEDNRGYSFNVNIDSSKDVLPNMIIGLVSPIVYSILSPKVMLLFIINFEIMGLIDPGDISNLNKDKIIDLVYRKIFVLLKSIITFIKDKIVEILMSLVWDVLKPEIAKLTALMGQEILGDWIRLLNEALKCIPMFDFSKYNLADGLDEVHYADIIPKEQTEPESTDTCQ